MGSFLAPTSVLTHRLPHQAPSHRVFSLLTMVPMFPSLGYLNQQVCDDLQAARAGSVLRDQLVFPSAHRTVIVIAKRGH